MISLLHPSRSRPNKAFRTATNWLDKSSESFPIEHIVSVDIDDPFIDDYFHLFGSEKVIINSNRGIVEAVNHAAKKSTGQILVYMSDDFDCPQDWDMLLIEKLSYICKMRSTNKIILRVNDCSKAHRLKLPVLTIPIMTKHLYHALGYFMFPEYLSMHADNDLYFTTKRFLIECPEIKFPHLHHSEGHGQNDNIYQRNEANWNQGAEIFNRRAAEFGWPFKAKIK
jgi:hypothetical protein